MTTGVPGEANEGLVARILASPARLAAYDESGRETCSNVRLVVNGPLAEPRGGIFMRHATLAFESPG